MTDAVPFLPFKSDAKDAPAYWLLDVLWIVHVTGEQTAGRYSVIEQYMPEGSGPPPQQRLLPAGRIPHAAAQGPRRARLAAGGAVLQQLLDRARRTPVGVAEG